MPKRPLIIASILSVLAVLGVVSLSAWRSGARLEETREALEEAQTAVATNQAQAAQLEQQVAALQARVAELEREKETVSKNQRTLEEEMRAALESKDVTISQLQGKLTVSILDHVLFDSGEATLKPDGEAVLQKVAAWLAQHPQLKIHVIGHTDNVPIRPAARNRFPSNWELSTARASAAVRFLTEAAGVDPRRVGVVGYGEHRPVADNATPEGRARNRRIAITVLSEELAGADVAPTTTTNPPPAGTLRAAESVVPEPSAYETTPPAR